MMTRTQLGGTLFCIAPLAAACGSPSGPKDQSATDTPSSKPEAAETQAAVPAPAPETPAAEEALPETQAATPAPLAVTPVPSSAAPATQPATSVAPTPARPAPAPTAPVAATAPASTPAPAPASAPASTPDIVDPGGTIAVAATKTGLKRIGSEACGDCHDVQFDSWAKGPHASRTPPLDCESCHGPGSEYKSNAVMKDPAKAKAAGLVMPDKAFCSQCHKKGVTDDLMKRAHAHDE